MGSFFHKKNNLLHYMGLIVGFCVLLSLFYFFRYSYLAKVIISLLVSIYYLAWGIAHHKIHERLTKDIVFEYVSFGLLVFVLLLAALNV